MDSVRIGQWNQNYQERNIAIGNPTPHDIHFGYGYAFDQGPVGPIGTSGIWSIRHPKDTVQIGNTNLQPDKDNSIHIGSNLTKNTDINIGDMLTVDKDTNTLKLYGNVKTKSINIAGLLLQNVECDICSSDEEIAERVRMCILRQKIRDGEEVSQEDKESLDLYNPRTSPGIYFQIEDESHRSICANCIFESAFDFSHRMRFSKYTEEEASRTKDEIYEMKQEIENLTILVTTLSQTVKMLMRTV